MNLITEFNECVKNVSFETYGIIDKNLKIHSLGTDSKIIGRIFEMISQPILEEIAKNNNLLLETPEAQTLYPDFILHKNKNDTNKIAIDIKTTYIDSDNSSMGFTLGSYGSYMRNNTKNIAYKYTDYKKHYVIGFVYKRNDAAQESSVYDLKNINTIQIPYKNVKCFIQEKYKIAGFKPGSGNTENIGSISTRNFQDFVNGNGPFKDLGKEVFDIYWKYHPKYRESNKIYTDLDGFIKWILKKPTIELFYDFDYSEIIERIKKYKNE